MRWTCWSRRQNKAQMMTNPALLRREIRALVFDQHGTGDMQKGLTEAVAPFHSAKASEGSAHQFVTW